MSMWHFSCEARDPTQPSIRQWEVGILEPKYRLLRDKGHKVKHARLVLAAEVLQDCTAIYEGWARPGKHDCYVYVGKPSRDVRNLQDLSSGSIEAPAPTGMLFVVFVMDDGSIDDWGWREASADNPDVPQGVTGKLIWPQ